MDRMLLPILDDLRACLCAALAERDSNGCFCGLYPGPQVTADWCDCKGRGKCGMAWVRLVRAFPSSASYPSQDTKPGSCAVVVAAVIELGVYRCLPGPDSQGNVDAAALANATIDQVRDAGAMLQAIQCCTSLARANPLLGVYAPTPNPGNCGGGTWPVTVQLLPR